jgi:hypothetical protein
MRHCTACRADSRLCAIIVMTSTVRAFVATVHGGNRTAGATARLLSPRLTEDQKLNEREKATFGGIGHGSVRAIEDLRGMRLSLVPRPDSENRLLLSLFDRIGEVSKP